MALAEDLTSETFLAAVDAVRSEHSPPLSRAWLIGVARHKLADHWRRTAREERRLDAVTGAWRDVDDSVEQHIDAVVATQVLRRLAPQHRLALTLRYVDDLPVAAVAEHVGRTVHATEALLVRARRSFRRSYPYDDVVRGGGGGAPWLTRSTSCAHRSHRRLPTRHSPTGCAPA